MLRDGEMTGGGEAVVAPVSGEIAGDLSVGGLGDEGGLILATSLEHCIRMVEMNVSDGSETPTAVTVRSCGAPRKYSFA